ncbi:MAG: transglutaminase family protein [Proteobacteria bacterium]|nr:transglutaminase family protein [Pseudomonadota bacterium]
MTDAAAPHLRPTTLLDFGHPSLRLLIETREWRNLPERERIGAVYAFVRDEVAFGYNASDDLRASAVLGEGRGQCNTKTILLMALLRGTGTACRFHGATIHKSLQKGVVTGLFYRLAPDNILHSWAEVLFEGRWLPLEGVILDKAYLAGVRCLVSPGAQALLGYGVGTDRMASPEIDWRGEATWIQSTGINGDFGTFDDPDTFYSRHGANLSGFRGFLFRHLVRHIMNLRVRRIRRRSETSGNHPGRSHSGAEPRPT